MRESCRPTSRQPATAPSPKLGARPVIGHGRFRFFTLPPAQVPVYPAKIWPNSFVERNLPVTLMRSIFYKEVTMQLLENKDFSRWEGGLPSASQARIGNGSPS